MKVRTFTAAERGQAIQESFAGVTGRVLELRAAGAAVNDERRAELLAAAVNREAVEVEVDILAYEQEPGKANRNFFRFRDGAMVRLGASGVGTPFLKDHDRWSVDAIGGEVIASKTAKLGDGQYEIRQTVRLTEPAAVERALRGNLKAVSIGAFPTGPVLCSHCGTPVMEECWHYRGQELEADDAGGTPVVIEWIYTEAELVETSEVPIGAVPRAGVQTIRAALAAAGNDIGSGSRRGHQQEHDMKNRTAIVAKLKLAGLIATAVAEPTDADIEAGIDSLIADRAELAIVNLENAATAQSAEEKFIQAALETGRILTAEADTWRDFFRASPQRAQERMGKRPANCATLVGAPKQRDVAEPAEAAVKAAAIAGAAGTTVVAMERDAKSKAVLAAAGVDFELAAKFAAVFGAEDPKAAIAKHAAGVEDN